jgi:hypothetical protein
MAHRVLLILYILGIHVQAFCAKDTAPPGDKTEGLSRG